MVKGLITISLDTDLVKLAKAKYSNLSGRIESLLKADLELPELENLDNEKDMDLINTKRLVLENQLKELEKIEKNIKQKKEKRKGRYLTDEELNRLGSGDI